MRSLQPLKIVIRCPNWVGDLVMCTPALRALRHHFTGAHISVMVKPSLRPVIENLLFFDEIIEYEPRGRDRGMKKYLSCINRLKRKQFDLGILLPHSFSSALVFYLASIPQRVGYSRNARGWMLTHCLEPFRERGKIVPVHMVKLYLTMCKTLGCQELDEHVELKTSASADSWVDGYFADQGIVPGDLTIVMIPGATFGSSKCWGVSYFARVADTLIREYGARILIAPGPGEVGIAQSIKQAMEETSIDRGDTVLPLDLLMALIKRCSLLISNDTGPRHFGVAFDKPVIVIMGPTDPRYTDYNLDKTVVIREAVDCAPCHLKECPSDHRCMTRITPEKVLAAARDVIVKYNLVKQ